jgi:DNA-3-methyladenine glycosylase
MTAGEFPVETVPLARALIGCVLVSDIANGRAAGRIVETEAYVPGDPASHAFRGPTGRTRTMFGEPLHAYVYVIYGRYHCFNVSSEPAGIGAGVLVRALEPLDGLAFMRERRGVDAERELCRGPGRLTQALALDRSVDGWNLVGGALVWLARGCAPARVGSSRRIGLSRAASRRLRYYERGNPFVSGPRNLSP